MTVSRHDRDVMSRIGEHKRASHTAAAEEHRALAIEERLDRSWELYLLHRDSVAGETHDDPTPFYERARKLRLYEG